MNPKPIDQAKNPLLGLALPALIRARKRAELIALLTGTDLVQMVDGKIVHVPPDVQQALEYAAWLTGSTVTARDLLESALALPEPDRVKLAAELLASVAPSEAVSGATWDDAWLAEVKEREDHEPDEILSAEHELPAVKRRLSEADPEDAMAAEVAARVEAVKAGTADTITTIEALEEARARFDVAHAATDEQRRKGGKGWGFPACQQGLYLGVASTSTDDLLAAIRRLPLDERRSLIERATQDADEDTPKPSAVGASPAPSLLGLMGDQPELVDEMCSLVYKARSTARMRTDE